MIVVERHEFNRVGATTSFRSPPPNKPKGNHPAMPSALLFIIKAAGKKEVGVAKGSHHVHGLAADGRGSPVRVPGPPTEAEARFRT